MPFKNISLLILRLAGGLMMLTHGYPKFMKLLNGDFSFADPIGLGEEVSLIATVFAEFVCAILVALGLYTRLASVPVLFTMLVAALIVHGGDPFAKQELGLMYASIFAVTALNGGGDFSLDKIIRKKNK
ncbi:DoxX family protein [Marivirga arenosa]|jgi:putative oxidoreductase|uniref:DoxX family protein n=1 Tax=Marivirga arenosa TaxID=3059076 RepID=A0AA49J9B7_9BACT|nr:MULTISPECIES: DoxX family protein [unclassified Marivirga]WKK80317.2 DoxX family protein [Marivirga sp. BKB1-2]WMN06621.1 DoxX family protein [Marivirga sp. ABR2-2]